MLRSGFSEDRAHQQLDLAIDWGRYAELYSFDADTGQLKLDHLPSADASAAVTTLDQLGLARLSRAPGHLGIRGMNPYIL
jgi:C-terminal AAA-associated domain